MKNKKSLGQNWLNNRAILEEIAELAAGGDDSDLFVGAKDLKDDTLEMEGGASGPSGKTGVKRDEICLEIGPGLGTLTSSLLKRFKKVIAVEYDERLAKNLPKSFPGTNLEVVKGDILEFDFSTIKEKYVIAGNIPYYITSPILKKVLTLGGEVKKPERIVLLMQKEVAERIASEKETVLSLLVKNRAKVRLGPVVGREEFMPAPKVDSQVIVLEPKEPEVDEVVMKLIEAGFRAPRKKLVHNLAGVVGEAKIRGILKDLGINENVRPGDLHLKDWERISGAMK